MEEIHEMAVSGKSIHAAMGTQLPMPGWDDILVLGAQLDPMPASMTLFFRLLRFFGWKPRVKLIVSAALRQKLLVGAALDDTALLENHDAVGVAHGGEPVGDHDHGLTCGKLRKRLLYLRLVIRISKSGSLIQDQDRCIF